MVLRPSLVAVVAGLALAGMAACSQDGSAGEDSDSAALQGSAPAELDPCSVLKPQQATKAGLPAQEEFEDQISSEPGCRYQGEEKMITIFRNAEKTLDEYGQQENWGEFTKTDVNGRPGARAVDSAATDDMCTTMLSAAGGVVVVDAQAADPRDPFDGCGASLDIAETIEPSLPE
ncbi:DUF3558 family protein [Parasphingorhabdus pacifica]